MVNFRSAILFVLAVFFAAAAWGQSADQLYSGGHGAFTDELWTIASSQFSRLLRDYPDDPRADSAAYMEAVAHYQSGNYQRCVEILTAFPRRYADSVWNRRVAFWEGMARFGLKEWDASSRAFGRQLSGDSAYREPSLFYLGVCLETLGRMDEAEEAYAAIQEEGRDYDYASRALYRLGQIQLSRNRPGEALENFTRLAYEFSASPLTADIEYWIAESQRLMGNNESALERYRNFLETVYESPNRDQALLKAARLASLFGESDEALAYLDLRDEERPAQPDESADLAIRIRAESYLRTQRIPQAREAYRRILNQSRNPAETQTAAFHLAQTYLGTDEVRDAVSYLKTVENGPSDGMAADALYQMGTILAEDAEGAAALERLSRRFPEDPRREEALRLAARFWRDHDEREKAVTALNTLLRDYGESDQAPAYLFVRGEMFLSDDDETSALGDYAAILRDYADSSHAANAHSRIGFIYAGRGEFSRAADHYRLAADLSGGVQGGLAGLQAVYSAGAALLNARSYDEAVEFFDQIVRFDPAGPFGAEAAFHMGGALYEQQKYARARAAYRSAARHGGMEWTFKSRYEIGWTWFQQSAWSEAGEAFLAAADAAVNPQDKALSLYRAGLCLASMGEWDAALLNYDQALLEVGEWREEALYQRAWALLNAKRAQDAAQAAGQLAEEFPETELPADLWFRMGENAMNAGDYLLALSWYDRTHADYPGTALASRARLRGALAARQAGRAADSASRYGAWVLERPEDPESAAAVRSWAEALKDAGNPRLAREARDRIREAQPNDWNIVAPIVLAWTRVAGIPAESADLLETIAENEDLSAADRTEALLLRAHRYRLEGQPRRARRIYEVIIRDIPGRTGAEAQEGLALSYADEGRVDDAVEAYLALPYLYPEQEDLTARALREAERLYRETGRDEEADAVRARRGDL